MGMSLQQLQAKFLAKAEEKCTGAMSLPRLLRKLFQSVDLDDDGFVTVREWAMVVEKAGNVLTSDEACALFEYWDSAAYQREPTGQCAIADALASLSSSEGGESGIFGVPAGPPSSGDPQGNRGNRSSLAGGIFGGGVYESDAQRVAAVPRDNYVAPSEYAHPADMPRGNQPSIEGGIFGGEGQQEEQQPHAQKKSSNTSSVPGGIFATDENSMQGYQPPKKRNANASSVPGGIFG